MAPVSHLSLDAADTADFGDFEVVKSQGKSGREFVSVTDLDALVGQTVWLRGRVANVRAKGNSCFVVLRQDTFNTVQVSFKPEINTWTGAGVGPQRPGSLSVRINTLNGSRGWP